ncbi:MAG: hypothetical protein IKL09_03595, partial [Clostridia bacterium]|nr:hypothetical protein [Clostridia bacterium]
MKYSLNAAIPLKRLKDLNDAKKYLIKTGISVVALDDSYFYFKNVLDARIREMVCSDTAKTVATYKCLAENNTTDTVELCCDLTQKMWIDIIFEEYKKNDALKFAQFLLQTTVQSTDKENLRWRIIDPVNAGASVGKLSKIVTSDENLFGGKFFCTDDDIRKLRTELDTIVKENIKTLNGKYESVYGFNANEEKH